VEAIAELRAARHRLSLAATVGIGAVYHAGAEEEEERGMAQAPHMPDDWMLAEIGAEIRGGWAVTGSHDGGYVPIALSLAEGVPPTSSRESAGDSPRHTSHLSPDLGAVYQHQDTSVPSYPYASAAAASPPGRPLLLAADYASL
jgi:hypothetical protein